MRRAASSSALPVAHRRFESPLGDNFLGKVAHPEGAVKRHLLGWRSPSSPLQADPKMHLSNDENLQKAQSTST